MRQQMNCGTLSQRNSICNHNNYKDNPAEIQMQRRLDGFMSYIAEEYNNLVIHEVVLNKSDQESNQQTLDEFFQAHPKALLGVVFNSRVYQL